MSYGAVKGGENVVRVARSLVPLGAVVLRPSYAQVLVEQRAALKAAMLGLVDEQGWVVDEGEGESPPRECRRPPWPVEPPKLARRPSTRDQRELEEMHGEAAEAAKVKMGAMSPGARRNSRSPRWPSAASVLQL